MKFPYPGSGTTINDFTGSMESNILLTCYNPNDPGGVPASNNYTSLNNFINSSGPIVYPNPASDDFFIEIDKSVKIVEVSIITLTGSLIYKKIGMDGESLLCIDASDFPAGQYYIKMISESDVYYKQIIIEK